MNTTPILRATNIVKKLGGKTILNDVSLDVHKGDVKVVIGPSGAGKSTFLQCLNYLLPPDSGDIWLEGKKVNARDTRELCALRQQVGMIFQDFQLLHDRTVYRNLRFVLKATGWTDNEKIDRRIIEVLAEVGMSDKAEKMPSELSGGEQQRIAIARALLNKPKIIIADEPTGNLDPETAASIVSLLQAASKEGTAVVMSTHNVHLIDLFPGKVYRCKNRVFSLIDDGERQREMEEEDAEEMAQKG